MRRKYRFLVNEQVQITYCKGTSNKVVIVFGSLHVKPYREEFYNRIPEEHTTVFVIDLNKNWGNSFDVDYIVRKLSFFTKDKEVYTFGLSMGGHLAIAFSGYLNAAKCLALVPQYTIHPDIVKDSMYSDIAKTIADWNFVTAEFNDKTRYDVITSNNDEDTVQNELMLKEERDNVSWVILKMPDFHHGIAEGLDRHGYLQEVIDRWLLDPDTIYDIFSAEHIDDMSRKVR